MIISIFFYVNLKLRADGSFNSALYVKPTDKGLYANYESHIPEQYKLSVINSLVHRAIKLSSSTVDRDAELSRITQVLVNNGYPLSTIDKRIKSKLQETESCDQSITTTTSNSTDINLFAELHNVSHFKDDTRKLRKIIKCHVKPLEDGKNVKLTTFYKPLKLSSKFSTRIRPEATERSCLVYQFECPQPSCHEVKYIGYTNQRLSTRVKQHRRKTSSIFKHFMDDHNDAPPKYDELIRSFSILYSSGDLMAVKIAEAIFIKNDKPLINVEYNELYDILWLF